MATAAQPIFSVHASVDEVELGQEIEFSIHREGKLDLACSVIWRVVPPAAGQPVLIDPAGNRSEFDAYDQVRGAMFQTRADPAIDGGGVVTVEIFDPSDDATIDPKRARVSVTVLYVDPEPIEPEPPIDPEPEPGPEPTPTPEPPKLTPEIPTAKRILVATSKTQLQNLLNTGGGSFDSAIDVTPKGDRSAPLRPGDHVVLKQGPNFSGSYIPIGAVVGTARDPIIVRSEHSTKRTKLTGVFKFNQPYLGVAGLEFSGGGVCVEVGAKGCRVSRNLFRGQGTSSAIINGVRDKFPGLIIDRNSFWNFSGAAIEGGVNDGRKTQNVIIELNDFWQHSARGTQETVSTFLMDQFNDHKLTFRSNLFRDCCRNSTNQKELVSGKTGGIRFIGNTIMDSGAVWVSLRCSDGSLIDSNWIDAAGMIKVFGDDHVIRNNHTTAGMMAYINMGTAYSDSADPARCANDPTKNRNRLIWKNRCAGAHCGARNTVLENNAGTLKLGHDGGTGGTFKAKNTKARNNQKAVDRIAGGYEGLDESSVGKYQQVAKRLSPEDVGHNSRF